MASRYSDIEDFTIEELRAEILRREKATKELKCWYCAQSISVHTCKFSHASKQS